MLEKAKEKWWLNGETALELLSGIAPVRGKLELSKRFHEGGGGSAGEERGGGVEKAGKRRRAESVCASTNPQVSHTAEVQALMQM